jgi:hypothetical protein
MDSIRKPISPHESRLRGLAMSVVAAAALSISVACGNGDSSPSAQATRTVTSTPPTATITVTESESSVLAEPDSTSPTSQTQYLGELEPVTSTGSVNVGPAEINGRGYPRSVTLAADGASPVDSVEYNLGRNWRIFSAAIGLRDDSLTGGSLTFEVAVDGTQKYKKKIPLGESQEIKLDLNNALRLKLTVTYDGKDLGNYYGSWGDVQIQK